MFAKNTEIAKDFKAIIFIIVVILFGYYGLFHGANFFVDEDPVTNFNYAHGNAMGNGWRPDKGFGISYFFGEPGLFHAWSIFTLWERIVRSPIFAFNSSVLFLLIAAAISQYFFLKRVAPGLRMVACILAPLIVFGPLQHEFYFQRIMTSLAIGTPLFLMLLHDFYAKSRFMHLFQSALLFWFVLFFGSSLALIELVIVGILFTITYYIYYKGPLKRIFFKSVLIFAWSAFWVILLGAWIFYSIIIEQSLIGYVREAAYKIQTIFFNIRPVFYSIVQLFHSGWFPASCKLSTGGISFESLVTSWSNASVVFPAVFIYFLSLRATDFWEFTLKWLIVILLANELLISIFPIYCNLLLLVFNGYPLSKFQPAYHSLQVALIGIFLCKIFQKDYFIKQAWLRRVQKVLAILMLISYLSLGIAAFFGFLIPDMLVKSVSMLAEHFTPAGGVSGYPKDFFVYVTTLNTKRFVSAMYWYFPLFYLISALLIIPFIKNKWLSGVSKNSTKVIAALFLLNGILLSWSVYPLNRKDLVWEQRSLAPALSEFKETDRFYNLEEAINQTPKTLESFKKYWEEIEGGTMVGYWSWAFTPRLSLSSPKSFCQKDVAEFTFHIFNSHDKKKRIGQLRDLLNGPMISSPFIDMGAVSYYYSSRPLTNIPNHFSFYLKDKQLYVYKNLLAWPYFYLAERVEAKKTGEQSQDVQRGTAYLLEKDFFSLTPDIKNSGIKLNEFSFGKLVFDYYGNKENFLVVADAWHPFWKAKADNMGLPVVKANAIFKGVKLPAGKHKVTLYYDTSYYLPGVYISIFTWIIFMFGWFFAWRFNK